MNRRRIATSLAFCGCISFLVALACTDFTLTIQFVTPDRAESTDTQTVAMPAAASVRVTNDIGSTRITVDPNATDATVEVTRIALADTQEDADALLAQMTVTITPPSESENVLVIDAQRPEQATDDESQFQTTITDDEVTIQAIVGSAEVAQYKLRITIPPAHAVDATQVVGPIRAVGLDTPSTLTTTSGSIRSIGSETSLTAQTGAGGIDIEAHKGSLDLDTLAGSLDIEIVSLLTDEQVVGRVKSGRIDLNLPSEINAQLRALTELGTINFRESDFAAASDVTETRVFVEATLGTGGPNIDVRTEVGSIDIDSF